MFKNLSDAQKDEMHKNFQKYLTDNGITKDSYEYDDLWADFLFGGVSPNRAYERVNDLYNQGVIDVPPSPAPESWLDQWQAMDGTPE